MIRARGYTDLRHAARERHAYDAVILNLTLPGDRGGAEVLALIQALDPQGVDSF